MELEFVFIIFAISCVNIGAIIFLSLDSEKKIKQHQLEMDDLRSRISTLEKKPKK